MDCTRLPASVVGGAQACRGEASLAVGARLRELRRPERSRRERMVSPNHGA